MINQIAVAASTTIELSRAQLLNWVNTTIKASLTKLEFLGQGWPYCQLLDIIYPGKVPLNKVNFKAKSEYEYISNFKVLQQSFNKLSINKNIDIEKLVKCKYQDNLEFLQWFKRVFDVTCGGRDGSLGETMQHSLAMTTRDNSNNQSRMMQQSTATTRRETTEDTRGNSLTSRNDFLQVPQPQHTSHHSSNNNTNLNNISNIIHLNSSHCSESAKKKQPNPSHHSQDNISFEDVLGQLAGTGNAILQGNSLSLKMETEFYKEMLKEIGKLLETWDKDRPAQELIQTVNNMLMTPPPEVDIKMILGTVQSGKENIAAIQ